MTERNVTESPDMTPEIKPPERHLLRTVSIFSGLALAARAAVVTALNQIKASSAELDGSIASAKTAMSAVAAAAVVIFVLVQLVAFRLIARPIRILTEETERLANGDLSDLRMSGGAGEVGRMALALGVFRNNSLEKLRLEAEEKETASRLAAETARRIAAGLQRMGAAICVNAETRTLGGRPARLLVFLAPDMTPPGAAEDMEHGLALPWKALVQEDEGGAVWIMWQHPEESLGLAAAA